MRYIAVSVWVGSIIDWALCRILFGPWHYTGPHWICLDESILVLFVLGLNPILLAQKGHNILCFTLKQ